MLFLSSFWFFFIFHVTVRCVCIFVLLHLCVQSATSPALLCQHIVNSNWTELYYWYIQEQLISIKNSFLQSCNMIDTAFRCLIFSFLCYMFSCAFCYLLLYHINNRGLNWNELSRIFARLVEWHEHVVHATYYNSLAFRKLLL